MEIKKNEIVGIILELTSVAVYVFLTFAAALIIMR
jgi:hypothetical protein